MTDNLFDNAKFGDMFLTTEKKQAVFLRLSENAENKFAILYVEDWGTVQVFRHNGNEVNGDIAHSIIKKQEEPVSEDLEEASRNYADNEEYGDDVYYSIKATFKAGAKWQKEKMITKAIDGKVLANGMGNPILHLLDKGRHLIDKKVKVILIKED